MAEPLDPKPSLDKAPSSDKREQVYERIREILKPIEGVLQTEVRKMLESQSVRRLPNCYEYGFTDPRGKNPVARIYLGNDEKLRQVSFMYHEYSDPGPKEKRGTFWFNDKGQIEMVTAKDEGTGWGHSDILDPIYNFFEEKLIHGRPRRVIFAFRNPLEMQVEASGIDRSELHLVLTNGTVPGSKISFEEMVGKAAVSILPKYLATDVPWLASPGGVPNRSQGIKRLN